jgi:hypothetical protein
MRKILGTISLSLIVLLLGLSIGCGGGTIHMPEITGGTIESSGASGEAGFVIAETPAGEEVNIIITAMDDKPADENLLEFVITTATDDARAKGEEDSFDITNASQQSLPHEPTLIIYTSTKSGDRVYAGWYCNVNKELFIVSIAGTDASFIPDIKCHQTE